MILLLCLHLLLHLASTSSSISSTLLSPCLGHGHHVQGSHAGSLTRRASASIEYYTWNNHSNHFKQHCDFNDEATLHGKQQPYLDEFPELPMMLLTPNKSQSQARQDIIIAKMFDKENYPNPVYVDLASNHWMYISNTYHLDHARGWRGICIEPTPEYLAGLIVNRSCIVVKSVIGPIGSSTVEYAHHGSLGGIVGKNKISGLDNYGKKFNAGVVREEVTTVSLSTVLHSFGAPRVMEYLSLDVEGAESLVLSGLDSGAHVFLAMTVERPTSVVHKILLSNDYAWVTRLARFGECLYINKIHPKFDSIMATYKNSRNRLGTRWKTDKHATPIQHEYLLDRN